jgi:hypothetical protein
MQFDLKENAGLLPTLSVIELSHSTSLIKKNERLDSLSNAGRALRALNRRSRAASAFA